VHGIVLMQLKRYVEHSYGPPTWTALLMSADLPGRMYTAMAEYPDAEVLAIVEAACRATGKTTDQILEGFGRFMVPGLVGTYSFLVQPGWSALDFIENTEKSIHTVVRTRDGAAPPVLGVTRLADERLWIRYSSARRLCALATGMVKGVGDFYKTPLDVEESQCMRDGAAHCLLEVSRVHVTPPMPRASSDELTGANLEVRIR